MIQAAKRIFSLLSPKKKRMIFALQAMMTFVAFLDLCGVASVAPFIACLSNPSIVTENKYMAAVYRSYPFADLNQFYLMLGVAVLLLILVANASNLLNNWLLNKVSCQLGSDFSTKLFRHYMLREYLFHTQVNSADLSSKVLMETQRLAFKLILPILQINSRIIVIALLLIAIFLVNPLMAGVVMAVVGASYLVIYSLVKKKLSRNGKIESVDNELRMKLVNEGFGGIKEIKLFHKERAIVDEYDAVTRRYFNAIAVTNAISMAPRYILEAIAFGGVVGGLIVMLLAGREFRSVLPLLAFYVMAGYKLMPALQVIFSSISSIKGALNAFANIESEIKEIATGTEMNVQSSFEHVPPLPLKREIALQDVEFSYPGSSKKVLNDFSLEIAANTTIGFAGPSGAGKSTIIDLLLGLISARRGRLCVDGCEITVANLASWRASVGYVPQFIYLSDATIAENVAFGRAGSDIDRQKVLEVCGLAKLSEFIEELPNGIDTVVGERGAQLSGGQRQRIGIARALYREPRVLIFDEATSALDGVTEGEILEAVGRLKHHRTIIMIAHRLSTLKDCDVIHVIDRGQIVESGVYDELMRFSRRFQDLAKAAK